MNGTIPTEMLAAVREHHQQPCAINEHVLQSFGVALPRSGMNNSVYICRADHQPYCIKVYKVDDRCRAEREWLSLRLFAAHGLAVAPQPLWFDPHPQAPVVGMEYLAGAPLPRHEIGQPLLVRLASTLSRIYALTPASVDYPYIAVGRAPERIKRIEDWVSQMRSAAGEAVEFDLLRLAEQWLAGDARHILSRPAPGVFSPGDPNLANCLWDGTQVRCIDFEYGGWSDLAYDLADIREGLYAHQVRDEDWEVFLACFDLSDQAVYRRFCAARQLCVLFWGFLLWQRYLRNDLLESQLKEHLHRIQSMLDRHFV